MIPALGYTYLGVAMGVLLPLAIGWTLTSYPWHNWFHQNRARYLLRDRVVCAHCVREWMVCLKCDHRPCVCRPRAEAQSWVAGNVRPGLASTAAADKRQGDLEWPG